MAWKDTRTKKQQQYSACLVPFGASGLAKHNSDLELLNQENIL